MNRLFFFVLLLAMFSINSLAYEVETLYSGTSLESLGVDELSATIEPGTIVILSEWHGVQSHHRSQLEFLQSLKAQNPTLSISVGMEFISFKDQQKLNLYLAGSLAEEQFLNSIKWGNIPFKYYRPLVWFPEMFGEGKTLALNADRRITSKIARSGIESLTPAELREIPPGFELGNDLYCKRFYKTMQGHVPDDKIANYFAAQSVWDETMAAVSLKAMLNAPNQVLVIIVGDFHNIYGGGLPDRLRARGADKIVTISQVSFMQSAPLEIKRMIEPSVIYGPRADYIWTHK